MAKYKCECMECPDVGQEHIIKGDNNTEFINGVLVPRARKCPTCKQDMEYVLDFNKTGWAKPKKDVGKNYYKKYKN